MKVKVSEATNVQLDWMVAKSLDQQGKALDWAPPPYSTDWSQGGQVIGRDEIGIRRNAPCSAGREWEAIPSITAKGAGGKWGYGPTPLVAAMRCFVASRLGEIVEVPDDLA